MDSVAEIKQRRKDAKAELVIQTKNLRVAVRKKKKLASAARNS